jgi:hypothetical protein
MRAFSCCTRTASWRRLGRYESASSEYDGRILKLLMDEPSLSPNVEVLQGLAGSRAHITELLQPQLRYVPLRFTTPRTQAQRINDTEHNSTNGFVSTIADVTAKTWTGRRSQQAAVLGQKGSFCSAWPFSGSKAPLHVPKAIPSIILAFR